MRETTIGRSIIKLYDITSGNIYFKGIRIGAGLRSYRLAIKEAKRTYGEKARNADAAAKRLLKAERDDIVKEQKKQIKAAKYDRKNCDKQYARQQVKLLEEKIPSDACICQGKRACKNSEMNIQMS